MAGRGNIANLIPWKPGQSGNPGGRPKKRPFSDRYEAMADLPLPNGIRRKLKLAQGSTWGDAVSYRLFIAAFKGLPSAARELREAVEGKAAQRIELTGAGGKPLNPSSRSRPMQVLTPEQLEAITKLAAKVDKDEAGAGVDPA